MTTESKDFPIMVDISRLIKAAKLVLLINELQDPTVIVDFSGWEYVIREKKALFGAMSLNCLNDLQALVDTYGV